MLNGRVQLLWKKHNQEAGVLNAGLHINQAAVSKVKEFPTVFRSLGKLEGSQLRITINPSLKPMVQCRIECHFCLQESLESYMVELLAKGL
jgi:hypothetical protein